MSDKKGEKIIPRDVMLDILDSKDVIEDRITGHSRWSVHHTIIFAHEGAFYRAKYSVGATEMQDESPWECAKEGVVCVEVVPVQTTITVYEEKPN